MATYIIGGLLVVLVVLAVRSYFGKSIVAAVMAVPAVRMLKLQLDKK